MPTFFRLKHSDQFMLDEVSFLALLFPSMHESAWVPAIPEALSHDADNTALDRLDRSLFTGLDLITLRVSLRFATVAAETLDPRGISDMPSMRLTKMSARCISIISSSTEVLRMRQHSMTAFAIRIPPGLE